MNETGKASGVNNIGMELIYNKIHNKEKECFQNILINEIWDEYESSDNKNEVNPSRFPLINTHINIFDNDEENDVYNEIVRNLAKNETDYIDEKKIKENYNFISGTCCVNIKDFMNFDPLFVKLYNYQNLEENTVKTDYNINLNSNCTCQYAKTGSIDRENGGTQINKCDSMASQYKHAEKALSEESDDEIYTPKRLKLRKKKHNIQSNPIEKVNSNSIKKDRSKQYSSDESSDSIPNNSVKKKKSGFSNAFDVLVKRKDEDNEEAIEAFNYINSKKRNRHLSRSDSNHMRDKKEDLKKKSYKKNSENLKDEFDDIPEQYMHLTDQGLDANIIRYALSMKMDANEKIMESDIIGLYDIKKIIKDKIVNVILRPDLFTGLNRAAKGILLFGPPGTGKTMIAKWVASYCQCSFYNVNASSLFSKYIGETEKIVTSLFKCAEVDNPSILFFDEIDSILGMRKKDEDDTTIRIKNQLLQMIDGINTKKDAIIVIIGATNRPDMIDDAALRRFNKRVYIPLPDLQARKDQIRYIISKHTHSGFQMTEEELDNISQKLDNWNGSDIYHLCSKCYEYVYDDAVEQYNGIQNIPNTSIFRAIKYDDFIKAMSQVNTSYKNVFDYDEWSKMHGSL
ncbi:AAA family ATPase, putative [Plasmodium chabaudi chabaudi]|uniref:AAA family ATPase, putative n=1 Tax=Plasmodium chabaudi chabaudi TaxID=31271 RepID=A0A1C6XE50_PLACU|nr:AAA family ATPase, putative [Plasmodium chabaudi chabaudi]